ncbi:class I SAM-dependent methyltransferase [Embleya sp. NPDC055664]
MTTTEDATTVYGRPEFADIDIGDTMRHGHPDITDGDRLIVDLVRRRAQTLGRPLTVMDVGSGSGVVSAMLAHSLPGHRVIANEVEPRLIAQARSRLADFAGGEVFDRPFQEWKKPLDVVISWGSHHHLPNTYLDHVRTLLVDDGVLIIGDEFCPEYCDDNDAARVTTAEVIHLADGLVLTSHREVAAYRADGVVPQWSRDLEAKRRRALWHWYKFVVDYAMAKDNWTVVLAELQITRDDLTTSFDEEHKLSPLIVRRDLELNGFRPLSTNVIGNRPPDLQSFYLYEFAPRPRR